jgi:GNAT superfamily N-acetyltransferase
MQVALRHADRADERDVRELDQRARAGDVERIAFIHEAVARRCCLIAEGDGIIGYAVFVPRHFFARDFLELLFVHEDYRRRGVGRTLLRAVVDRADTPRVFSSTNESNTAMQSLFAAEGWALSGRLDGLDEGDPEVVYFIDR